MEITYYGHSCFKIKGTEGTVVTDPYNEYVGFKLPNISADVVTVSHHHNDHAQFDQVSGTARRKKPFIIDKPGEYEVGGISVFGVETFHDSHQGAERGPNIVYTIMVDNLRVCHLGDLGHELSSEQLSAIGVADVVLCPVGGVFTIDAKAAVKTIHSLEPSFAVPMHFKTDEHEEKVFGELATLADFLKEYGAEAKPESKLKIDGTKLPEETELVVLQKQ